MYGNYLPYLLGFCSGSFSSFSSNAESLLSSSLDLLVSTSLSTATAAVPLLLFLVAISLTSMLVTCCCDFAAAFRTSPLPLRSLPDLLLARSPVELLTSALATAPVLLPDDLVLVLPDEAALEVVPAWLLPAFFFMFGEYLFDRVSPVAP